jgi:hypothetical protein
VVPSALSSIESSTFQLGEQQVTFESEPNPGNNSATEDSQSEMIEPLPYEEFDVDVGGGRSPRRIHTGKALKRATRTWY